MKAELNNKNFVMGFLKADSKIYVEKLRAKKILNKNGKVRMLLVIKINYKITVYKILWYSTSIIW